MKKFERSFDVAALKAVSHEASVIRCLLDEWQLPGVDAETTKLGLRLAVRDGYLNFYAKGQSVAKLSLPKGQARLDVHRAYVTGDAATDYDTFVGADLAALGDADVQKWTEQALRYAGEEKRFVDELVSANAGTIDLEMALPGDERVLNGDKKVAPRMDLVVVQEGASGPELAFWEAKCAHNPEIRARGTPHVVEQVRKYVEWLRLPGVTEGNAQVASRGDQVLSAFQTAAQVLVELAELGGKPETKAVRIWKGAATSGLSAVVQPAVVIGNYCSVHVGRNNYEARTELLQRNASTFEANGHKAKLAETVIEQGIHVVEYAAAHEEPLPVLRGRTLGSEALVS